MTTHRRYWYTRERLSLFYLLGYWTTVFGWTMREGEMSKTGPALTAEEWAEFVFDAPIDGRPYGWQDGESAHVWANNSRSILYICDGDEDKGQEESVARIKGQAMRHALAAMCLYGQPFGFTWDDVDALRLAVNMIATRGGNAMPTTSVADRIAALLPPREP